MTPEEAEKDKRQVEITQLAPLKSNTDQDVFFSHDRRAPDTMAQVEWLRGQAVAGESAKRQLESVLETGREFEMQQRVEDLERRQHMIEMEGLAKVGQGKF